VLKFAQGQAPVTPKDAATLVLVRPSTRGVEVFCVERNKKVRFMGGAIVFPGGKLDERDRDVAWELLSTTPPERGLGFAADLAMLRALAVAACRESLEEAAILPVTGGALGEVELIALRTAMAAHPEALRETLEARALRLDLAALHPLAHWITPEAETRRFDARFFMACAPEGQPGAHDESETMASFWATPAEVLARFDASEVQLAPPTHRTLSVLAETATVEGAFAAAERACLDPICPKLVQHRDEAGDTLALVLPGDPEHEIREPRVAGASRYVLRGEHWRPGTAPALLATRAT
jgi:8-oxo-dGTP pyrophosphatase MutT (NUDIX family)